MAIRECLIDLDGKQSWVTIEHSHFGSTRWVRVRGAEAPGSDQLFVGRDEFTFDLLGHRASLRFWVEGVRLMHELAVGGKTYVLEWQHNAENEPPMNEYDEEILDDFMSQLAAGEEFQNIVNAYGPLGIDPAAARNYLEPMLKDAIPTAKNYSISRRRLLLVGQMGAIAAITAGFVWGFPLAYAPGMRTAGGQLAAIIAILGPFVVGLTIRHVANGFTGPLLQGFAIAFSLVSGACALLSARLILGHPLEPEHWGIFAYWLLVGLVWILFHTRRKKFRPMRLKH